MRGCAGGGTLPLLRRFNQGDYVYHRSTSARTSLDPKAKPEILRVTEVKPSGVIVLEGRCGSTISTHCTHCAPCHLPIEEHSVDPRLARPSPSHACEVCNFPDGEEWMLLCDSCGKGWHTYCLAPPLTSIPDGCWVCPRCNSKGITSESVEAKGSPVAAKSTVPPKYLQPLQGAVVMAEGKGRKARSAERLGIASYSGRQGRTHYFSVAYDDGTAELLSVEQVKHRVSARPSTTGGVDRDTVRRTAATARKQVSFPDQFGHMDLRTYLEQIMPGKHCPSKRDELMQLALTGSAIPYGVNSAEVVELCNAVRMDVGIVFLPWKWNEEVVDILGNYGCDVQVSADQGSFLPAHREHFVKAREAGVVMDIIGIAVVDSVTDLVVPMMCEFARVMVAARVSTEYITRGDPARTDWLCGIQRLGRLGVLHLGTCLWLIVLSTPNTALLREPCCTHVIL